MNRYLFFSMHQRQYPGEVPLNPVQFGFFPVDIIHLLAKKNHFLLCFYLVDLEGALIRQPVWFQYEEVESVSVQEFDSL